MPGPVRRALYPWTTVAPAREVDTTGAGKDGKSGPKPPPRQSSKIKRTRAMPKIKTNRAAAKRFRKTASGKYKCGHANRSHILTKKPTKRKRNLRQANHVRPEDAGRLDRMLPYA